MYNELTLEDKKQLYDRIFSIGNFNTKKLNDRLVLISLVSLAYNKLKQKDSTLTVLSFLLKVSGTNKDNSAFYQMLENLSILIEDFSYDCTEIDSCGLKTSQEIVNKIKEILNTWIPF